MQLENFTLADLETLKGDAIAPSSKPPRKFRPQSFIEEENIAEQEVPAAPTYSQEQLQAAEQEAYRRGFIEGEKEGKHQANDEQAQVNRELGAIVEQLAERIDTVFSTHDAYMTEWDKDLPKLALSIARKVAGKSLDLNPGPLVESVVMKCVERLVGEPHIAITVHERLADTLEQKLNAHFVHNSKPGTITINRSEDCALSDCFIQWEDGEAQRDTEKLWTEIEAIIHDMVISSNQRETAYPAMEAATEEAETSGEEAPPTNPSVPPSPTVNS